MGAKTLSKAAQELEAKISNSGPRTATLDRLRKESERVEAVLARFLARDGRRERRSETSCDPPLAEREPSEPTSGPTPSSTFVRG
jgi:hypothetical protein